MKKLILLVIMSIFLVNPAFSYDQDLAKSYEDYFQTFSEKGTGKALQMMTTKAFIEGLKYEEDLFVIDVRTPGETGVYGFTFENSIRVPMDMMFKQETLKQIPLTGKVVVVCKAGHRAMAISTGLRHIGFKNVFVLKNGIADIAGSLTPGNAY